jgi:uncharacterized membrane protein YfhO
MDDNARLQLQKMIKANNVEDQTELIRKLKHSEILRNDIQKVIDIKDNHGSDVESAHLECIVECNFLCTYYTDIYNKIRKDEIDLNILYKFLAVLEQIEKGELDQHEGSFAVGTLLKELYIDSALKKAEKLDKETETMKPVIKQAVTNMSWKEFKNSKKKAC